MSAALRAGSATPPRYVVFQHEDGSVLSVSNPKMVGYYVNHPDYTEVQVAAPDAVVIDGPLPEVKSQDDTLWVGHSSMSTGVRRDETALDRAERRLRQEAAFVAHLREHPPVDREQVRKFEMDLSAFRRGLLPEDTRHELAEFLVFNGARMVNTARSGATS